MNRSLKAVAITMAALVTLAVGGIWAYSAKQVPPPTTHEDESPLANNDQEPDASIYDGGVTVQIQVANDDFSGFVTQEVVYKEGGAAVQKEIVQDVFLERFKESPDIQIPAGARILDVNVWNETLTVNFSSEMKEIKIKDAKTERILISSIVNSLLPSSRAFTDVQFLVEGQRVERLFGYTNTRDPFMQVDFVKVQ